MKIFYFQQTATETNRPKMLPLECLVLGDSNIGHLMLGSSELNQYRHKDLLTHLCDRFFLLGLRQCVKSFTHSRSGQRNSLLDVVYSNNPEKISSINRDKVRLDFYYQKV